MNTTLGRDEAEAELRVAKKLKLAAADECEILGKGSLNKVLSLKAVVQL